MSQVTVKDEEKSDLTMREPATAPETPAQKQAPETQKSPEYLAKEKYLQELHDNRFEKKGARIAFHAVNFGGLHQIFNNSASVIITFMLATTGLASKMKNSMANGPIGKSLSAVLSVPGRIVNYGFKLGGMDFNKEINEIKDPVLKKQKLAAIAHEANRNAIETSFMTIAGFIALMPVYFLEKHRAGFLNKVDNWLHPGRTPEEKKAAALTPEDEPKETLWNLFRARIIALGVVFGIDQLRTNFDRVLRERHISQNKPGMYKNVESVMGWRFGDWIYNHIGEKPRNWIARFFSGSLDILPETAQKWFNPDGKNQKNNLLVSKIQPETREDIFNVINAHPEVRRASREIAEKQKLIYDNPLNKALKATLEGEINVIEKGLRDAGHLKTVERAVFAEQSRLFWTKEFALTTILSAIIYYCAKSPRALKFMEKVGLAKKGTYEKEHAELEARRHGKKHEAEPEAAEEPKIEEPGKFAAAVGQRKALAEPASLHTDKVLSQPDSQPQVAL